MAPVPPARHLLRAKDLIDARYREPLDVPALARAAHLSPAHFSREFRRTFGETPHQYLLTRRLERAAALLRTTDRSVADVCLTVGLTSVGSFTTSFGRAYGMSPRPTAPPIRRPSARARIPTCVLRAYERPRVQQFSRRQLAAAPLASGSTARDPRRTTTMIKQVSHVNVWVHDQDEALAWYTEKLGFEVREDVTLPELGGFRWLTVGPVGQPDFALALMTVPGPPVFAEDTAEKIRDLMARAPPAACSSPRTTAAATTRSSRAAASSSPRSRASRPYGVDAGLRDPSGNNIRIVQTTPVPSNAA